MVESSRADRHIFPASDRIDRSVFKILQSFTQRIFLRGIFGTCGADGIHKENVRFLGGKRLQNPAERSPVGRRDAISPAQSQQGGSVSANVGSFSNNVGRRGKIVSHNLGPKRR